MTVKGWDVRQNQERREIKAAGFRRGLWVAGALAVVLAAGRPAAAAETEDILSAPSESKSASEKPDDEVGGIKSFGEELSGLSLSATWSGYGDVTFGSEAGAPLTFNAATFNPILSVRMGEAFTGELEIEISDGGEIGAEYMFLDYQLSKNVVVRAGKFVTPIGRFNEVWHPSFRWEMVSRPLMFGSVMPAVWSDVGLQLRGTQPISGVGSFEYVVFAANGLKATPSGSTPDGDAARTTPSQLFRDAREQSFVDQNADKALGFRTGMNLFPGHEFGATTFGLSAYSSAFDVGGLRRAGIIDVDFSVRLGAFMVRAEAAQNFLGANRGFEWLKAYERGLYLQAGRLSDVVDVFGRFDLANNVTFAGDTVFRRAVAVALRKRVTPFVSLRGELMLPLRVEAGAVAARVDELSLAAMGAFTF